MVDEECVEKSSKDYFSKKNSDFSPLIFAHKTLSTREDEKAIWMSRTIVKYRAKKTQYTYRTTLRRRV